MKSIRQLACLAVMAAIGFLSTSAPAHATFQMSLSDGTNTVLVADNGSEDSNSTTGVIVFNGSLGVWTVNVSTGESKPFLGSSSVGEMDLNSINGTAGPGPASTLTIMLTDNNFAPLGPGTLTNGIGGTISVNGSASAQAWKDPTNTEFGHGGFTPGELGPFSNPGGPGTPPAPFSAQASVADTTTSAYSMTIQIVLTTNGLGAFNFSADDSLVNTQVPELDPGSTASGLTLVSGSLLMLFGRRRRACA